MTSNKPPTSLYDAAKPSPEQVRFHEDIERAKKKAYKRGYQPIAMLGTLTANIAEGAVALGLDIEDVVTTLREAYDLRAKRRG